MFVANVWLKEVGTVWGKLDKLREKWRNEHHKRSMESLEQHGLLGAGLFAVPGHPEWVIELAYWKDYASFKTAKDTPVPEWKAMVADLKATWSGPVDLWPKDQLPPNLELLEGDPISEEALALPIWATTAPV